VKILYPWSITDPFSGYMLLLNIKTCLLEHAALQRENTAPVLNEPPKDTKATFHADPAGPEQVKPTAQAGPKTSIETIYVESASVAQKAPSEVPVENNEFVKHKIVDRIEWNKPLSGRTGPAKTPEEGQRINNTPAQVQNTPQQLTENGKILQTNAQINNVLDEVDQHIETKVEVSLKKIINVASPDTVPVTKKVYVPVASIVGLIVGTFVFVSL
jgi:hypothetical protein